MGLIETKINRKIESDDRTQNVKSVDYLRPETDIFLTKDEEFDIPVFEIRAEGWYFATIHLWPKTSLCFFFFYRQWS